MNTCFEIPDNESSALNLEDPKEELKEILKNMCGCLFEKHLIKLHYEDISRVSRNPLMSKPSERR